MELQGRVIAVTGGAGGIGGAICADLRAAGAEVCALDLPGALPAFTDGIVGVGVDLTDEESVAAAFRAVDERFGRLDGLVVAAGVQLHGRDGKAADVPLAVWQATLAVNLTGAFLAVRASIAPLLRSPSPSVVLVGSPTGLTMEGAGYTAYSASKAGMMALARVVAADYADQGLRANVVVPGPTRTPLIDDLMEDDRRRAELVGRVPLGRVGEPEDVTGIVRWLLSDESRYATGAYFAVDGGMTAR